MPVQQDTQIECRKCKNNFENKSKFMEHYIKNHTSHITCRDWIKNNCKRLNCWYWHSYRESRHEQLTVHQLLHLRIFSKPCLLRSLLHRGAHQLGLQPRSWKQPNRDTENVKNYGRVLITEQIMLATGLNTDPIYTNEENPKKNQKKCRNPPRTGPR